MSRWRLGARIAWTLVALALAVPAFAPPVVAAPRAWPAAPRAAPTLVDSVAGFVRVAPGSFLAGSPADEPGRFDDETRHAVTLTRAYELCTHHVTQAEWREAMGWDDSRFAGQPDRPAENLTWFDAVAYCNARSLRERRAPPYTLEDVHREGLHVTSATVRWDRDADGYRLPTEAEWEFACRAGSTTAYWNGPLTAPDPARCTRDSGLAAISWYCANSDRGTHAIGTRPPNPWGFLDMAGNVQQWCWDWFAQFTPAPRTDPAGPAGGGQRVWRGGGWDYDPRHCRSADRGRDAPDGHFADVGLRVARGVR